MKIVWWALIAGLVMVGCGEEEDDAEETSVLEGTWQLACASDGEDYNTEAYVFSGDSMTAALATFTDSKCTTPQIAAEIKGVFKIGEDASSTTATTGATPLDVTVSSTTIEFKSADIVEGVNESEGCTETVVLNTVIDASKCAALFDGDGLPAVDSVMKTIFKIDGKNLTMGAEDSEDANGREDTFDSKVYVKQ
jgi:hypothetical protein